LQNNNYNRSGKVRLKVLMSNSRHTNSNKMTKGRENSCMSNSNLKWKNGNCRQLIKKC